MPAAARAAWGRDDLGDLTGRTAVVTGATSGIGLATATALAAHGAHVVLACRDPGRGRLAVDRIALAAPRASLEVLALDLSVQASVRRAASRLSEDHGRLDILINNAAVLATPFALTEDGFERQFATNHLGPFALTLQLLDLLTTTLGSRVVTVSSHLHRFGHLDLSGPAALQRLDGTYRRWPAYAATKLANLLFTAELDRRLRRTGAQTLALAAHPGTARTNLVAAGPATGGSALRARLVPLGGRLGQSAAGGALPVLYAAVAPGVVPGTCYGPGGPLEQFGPPAVARTARRARRLVAAARLWSLSEQLTGVVADVLGEPPARPARDPAAQPPGPSRWPGPSR